MEVQAQQEEQQDDPDVRQTLNVTASHVKEKMELIKAQKGRNIAGMRVARERLVGTRFVGARWLKRGGFAFTPRKDRPREVWPEAFRHEHKKIKEGKYYLPFRRIGRARYPITVITGPSLLDIYQPLHEKTMERALELLASNLEHEISRAFGG